METSENATENQEPGKSKKTSHRDRVLSVRSEFVPADYHQENPTVRAIYLSRTPCLQTFHSQWTRYCNFLVRPLEPCYPVSHWGLVVTTEVPAAGAKRKLKEWPSIRRTIDMQALPPDGDEGAKATVGSFDELSPIRRTAFSKLLYIGTTTFSDPEITRLADLVTEFLKEEGQYHGIFRNCQHWIYMLTSILCPDAKLPTRADEKLSFFYFFKHSNKNMKERVENAHEYCRRKLEEEERVEGEATVEEEEEGMVEVEEQSLEEGSDKGDWVEVGTS
jgi:hypothetical protein